MLTNSSSGGSSELGSSDTADSNSSVNTGNNHNSSSSSKSNSDSSTAKNSICDDANANDINGSISTLSTNASGMNNCSSSNLSSSSIAGGSNEEEAAAPFQPWKHALSREDAFRQALGEKVEAKGSSSSPTISGTGAKSMIDDRALRQLAAGGCPDESGIRGVVWRYLLDQVSERDTLA